jgi:alkylated DNA repair dioxygenase AlkB
VFYCTADALATVRGGITMITTVPGLHYLPDYLSGEEQERLLAVIDQHPWLADLKRRVQHYGYRYDYKRRTVDRSMFLGPLPQWAVTLAGRFMDEGWTPGLPDQLFVNEYLPGRGIASHIDCVPCFGDPVLAISLGSPCVMLFGHPHTGVQVPVLIEPGSLYVMQGEARYQWKHGIMARKSDGYSGRRFQRGRRISLTFRTVIQQAFNTIAKEAGHG